MVVGPFNTLSAEDKKHLSFLWTAYGRDLVHVRSACERKGASIPGHALNFVARLHSFFLSFLEQSIDFQGSTESSSHLIKAGEASCLREYSRFALQGVAATSDSVSQPRKVRLKEGRSVVAFHHEEFLNELNHFELKGQEPSTEFIRKDSFGAFLYHMPADAFRSLGCSMALAIVSLAGRAGSHYLPAEIEHYVDSTQLVVRFLHVKPIVPMVHIKTGLVGKFVTVKGHVVKARPKRLRVATADFGCSKCAAATTHAMKDGRYSVPKSCSTDNCRSRSFQLLRPTARYLNVQELRLQEAQDESTLQAGRTPRQLQVELTHDLVDSCRPGDIVLVACTVAAINTAVAAGRGGKRALETSSTYQLYLQGHSVTTLSERSQQASNKKSLSSRSTVYTQQQLQSITQLCHADHRYFGLTERRAFPFDLLVRSVCPSIIGHNEVKAGILLCLLGGTPPQCNSSADKSNVIRCNSHILIVGDPGMGKSQMLLAASQLAARSVYVGGNTSSTTGLTVTLTKEEKGESGMEAGALVLADQGICCIDEFDKMAKSHQDGLLETMEQQRVSIAKAGVVASLPARCSVVAAANPRHGNYSLNKSVGENLNMAKPILSRFDLVFILQDRANKDQDRMVSSNIMNLYRNRSVSRTVESEGRAVSQDTGTNGDENSRFPLSERLAWVTDFQKQPLPASLVRDYIAYAREYCKPKLTPEAATVLRDYFMDLRYPADGRRKRDTVPITPRQLEALIRLSQARAKACLRDFVLKEDALDVVELMSKSVDQVHSDDSGTVDRSRGGAGGTSNRKMKKAFVNEISRLIGTGNECSLDDLRRIAQNVGCGLSDFQSLLDEMRGNGVIMKKSGGYFQVLL